MSRSRLGMVAFCALYVTGAVTGQREGLSGMLPAVSIWKGEVLLDGDVTVPANGRLEITAGTTVRIAARDGSRGGWHPDRVEIHVHGQLEIDGKLEAPVVFVPDDGLQFDAGAQHGKSWHGIVLHARADGVTRRNVVRGAQLWRAFAAIQIPAGHALIEDCVFHSCSEGIEVGEAYKDERFVGTAVSGLADPEVRRSRFVGCYTGIYCSWQARAHVEQCVFGHCVIGIGPERPGVLYQQGRPGSRILRCAFHEVGDAVVGCSVVRESWFRRCKRALRLSSYHDRLATDIEHVVFENNLVDGVDEIVSGDTGAARDALRGTLRTIGPLDRLRAPWPPLPDCLQLAVDSAGRGRGLGGRDLGPMSGGSPGGESGLVPWGGAMARGWLAAPLEPPKNWQAIKAVTAGDKVGARWWAAADVDGDGLLHLKQAFGIGRSAGLLALPFTCSAAGKVRLPWSGDVAGMEVVLDGKTLLTVSSRRRFGAEEKPLEFACAAGAHLLLLRIEGWGVDPRFAIGVVDGWQVERTTADREVVWKVQTKRVRNAPVFEAKPSVAVHWEPQAGTDLVELRDPTGRTYPVSVQWTDAGLLRVTPVAGAPRKQELRLVWTGLRDLAGKPLSLDPTPVQLP